MNSTAHSLTLFRLKFFGSFTFIADPASAALHVRLAVHADATFGRDVDRHYSHLHITRMQDLSKISL